MSLIIRWGRRAGLIAAFGALAACSSLDSSDSFLGVITPYRIEVVQGNVVTREMAAAVRPGMSRTQVRDVLGSPLLTDIFHADRWDYMFTIRRQGTEPQRRRVTAFFEGERLARIEADELPSEQEFVDSINTFKRRSEPPSLQLTEAQLKALPAPPARAAEEAPPAAPARTYPPLEPAGR
jgi:outer membrane protein assembly factor BamE